MAATGAARARTTKTANLTVPIFKASGKGYVLVWGNKDLGTCMPLIAGEAFNDAIGVIRNALRAYHPNPKG